MEHVDKQLSLHVFRMKYLLTSQQMNSSGCINHVCIKSNSKCIMLKYIYILMRLKKCKHTYLYTISQLVYQQNTLNIAVIRIYVRITYSMTTGNMATREGRTKLKETGKAKGPRTHVNIVGLILVTISKFALDTRAQLYHN